MTKPITLAEQLQLTLDQLNLTIYGASQIIGAETGEDLKTIHYRLTQYLKPKPPKTIRQLEECLDALGYRLKIEPK